MLKVTKSRFYLIPVLMRTLDILELLSKSGARLKTNQISLATGVSATTTYRILRTLVHRGYLAQDLEGRFSILNGPGKNSLLDKENVGPAVPVQSQRTDLSGDEVIDLLHGVLQAIRQP